MSEGRGEGRGGFGRGGGRGGRGRGRDRGHGGGGRRDEENVDIAPPTTRRLVGGGLLEGRGDRGRGRGGGRGGRGRRDRRGKEEDTVPPTTRLLGASNAHGAAAFNSSAPMAGAAVVAGLILVAYKRAAKTNYPVKEEIDAGEFE